MNILSYIRKCCCLLLLIIPLWAQAQKSIEQKVDSMKREFMRRDSIRRQSAPKDTVKNELVRSPFGIIYNKMNAEKMIVPGVQQLLIQAARFRHSHYLNLVLKAGLAKPVTVNAQSKIYLMPADNQVIILRSTGGAISKGSERRNSSELKLAYDLPDDDFRLLLSKRIVSVKIEYVGGEWVLNMDNDGAEKIKKACLLTQ